MSTTTRTLPAAPTSPGRANSLRWNFSWTLLGNATYAGCQWGMVVAVAKLGSPALVGRFSFALALCTPIIMFMNLKLRAVQATDARDEYRFSEYLGVRLVTTAAAVLALAIVAAGFAHRAELALVIVAVGAAKCLESFIDVVYGLLQKHEWMDKIAISMVLRGVGGLAALGLVMAWTGSLWLGMLAVAAVWGILLACYDARNATRLLRWAAGCPQASVLALLKPRPRPARLKSLTRLALPLGCTAVMESLNPSLPRYYLQHYLGESALGYFSAAAYIMMIGNTAASALAHAAVPRLARYRAVNARAYARLIVHLAAFGAAVGLAGILASMLVGRQGLALLYGPEYAAQAGILTWLMVAAAMNYVSVFLYFALIASRCLQAQMFLYLGTLAATALSCALLVPAGGLLGAAQAVCIGAFVQLMGAAVATIGSVRAAKRGCELAPSAGAAAASEAGESVPGGLL